MKKLMITKNNILKIFIISFLLALILTVLTSIFFTRYTTPQCTPYEICPDLAIQNYGFPFVIKDTYLNQGVSITSLSLNFMIYFFISVVMLSVFYILENRSKKK